MPTRSRFTLVAGIAVLALAVPVADADEHGRSGDFGARESRSGSFQLRVERAPDQATRRASMSAGQGHTIAADQVDSLRASPRDYRPGRSAATRYAGAGGGRAMPARSYDPRRKGFDTRVTGARGREYSRSISNARDVDDGRVTRGSSGPRDGARPIEIETDRAR